MSQLTSYQHSDANDSAMSIRGDERFKRTKHLFDPVVRLKKDQSADDSGDPFKTNLVVDPKGYVQLYTKWDRQLAKTYKGFLDKISDEKLKSINNNFNNINN